MRISQSGAAASFVSNANDAHVYVSAQGGIYRLCWCAAGYSCEKPEDFVVDFGELNLVGPAT
jgi:hypothetical protein